jgi:hypothetical protein
MSKLLVVWKSNNDIDIHNFVIPYCYNAVVQEWFDEVELLIWGASQEKLMSDPIIQQRVVNLVKNNITVYACKMCSDKVGATSILESIGVNVRYTGDLLSNRLRDKEYEVITI